MTYAQRKPNFQLSYMLRPNLVPMSSSTRQSILRHLPSLLFAAFILRYFILITTHDPTKSRDPLIPESAIMFILAAIEFGMFLYPGRHSRGSAALFGFLALLCAILFLNIESWRYPFG